MELVNNVEKIRSWGKNDDGWYVSPNVIHVKLGRRVVIGRGVEIGNGAEFSDYVEVGGGSSIEYDVKIGYNSKIGGAVKLGYSTRVGDNTRLGDGVDIGDNVHLGIGVELGTGVTTEQLNLDFIEILKKQFGPSFLALIWVTEDRRFTVWDSDKDIIYSKGAIVTEEKAVISDQHHDVGLCVFPLGHRPEWYGLRSSKHNLIPLVVRVKTEDVCFARLPGMYSPMRVKSLEILD